MGYVRRHDSERAAATATGTAVIIEDDDLPDLETLSIGEPLNESYGAICGMLSEHMVDADRLNRWLLGLMVVAQDHRGVLGIPVSDALEAITVMSHADMAIAGFDAMNVLLADLSRSSRGKRGRRSD